MIKKIVFGCISLIAIAVGCGCYLYYKYFIKSIVHSDEKIILYIPSGTNFDALSQQLDTCQWLTNKQAFYNMVDMMKYANQVRPGRYEVSDGMSARALVSMLRSGQQKPVKVTFNNIRTLERLSGVVSKNLEIDSAQLLAAITDNKRLNQIGFNKATSLALYLPDTYQTWWTTDGEGWLKKMKKEYDNFWNDSRLNKAAALGLSPIEISTLASIVEEESNNKSEQPTIAKLYLNRLELGWPLQADPTLKFALGNFELRRILDVDKEIESPYNTYKYKGLPPGPIRIPSKSAIDAVLSPADCDYLFMCAKPDGSGTHAFARTQVQHNRNAAEYHAALNKRKIYR